MNDSVLSNPAPVASSKSVSPETLTSFASIHPQTRVEKLDRLGLNDPFKPYRRLGSATSIIANLLPLILQKGRVQAQTSQGTIGGRASNLPSLGLLPL